MNEDFILLDKSVTFADIAIAVKLKWDYVGMNDIYIEVVTVNNELKIKVTVKK